jgi:threonine dehydratase
MESKPSIADGTAGGIDPDTITFDNCRKFVDDFILVSEDENKALQRTSDEQITVADLTGVAVQDIQICKIVSNSLSRRIED